MTARNAFTAMFALLALGLAACAGPTPAEAAPLPLPTPVSSPTVATPTTAAPQGIRQQVAVTFYAAADNDPAGSVEIAYPNSRHTTAGGTGTYADPLSLATDPREIRPGVLVYYPSVRKYFVMEDDCAECIDDWSGNRTPHVDLWMSNTPDPAVQNCEAALTPDNPDTIIVNPPADLPVDAKPLYAGGRYSDPTTRRRSALWVATRSWFTRSRAWWRSKTTTRRSWRFPQRSPRRWG
jgi:hypothetical protein